MTSDDDYRLPTTLRPTHYAVGLKTDLGALPPTFSGEVLVTLDVLQDTSSVVFHIDKSLTVTHLALLLSGAATPLPLSTFSVDEKTQRGTLDVSDVGGLRSGKTVKLFIRYEAVFGDRIAGYFLARGVPDKDGNRQIHSAAMFEPTDARLALPCWDEPALKAPFAITMIAREGETCLSNMDVVCTQPWEPKPGAELGESYEIGSGLCAGADGAGWNATTFNPTPPMSTYLLAFAVGKFHYAETEYTSKLTGKTIPLRLYALPQAVERSTFALDAVKRALPLCETRFGVAYPLPKLDLLACNETSNGSENWGMITGSVTGFMSEADATPLQQLKRLGGTVAHELAHQWFGDIVTMAWWDDLWLNEAFAVLTGQLYLASRLWPAWDMEGDFLKTWLQPGLAADALRTSHPVETPCPDAADIMQRFDEISYSKGAAVLRMLMDIVGEDTFFEGVSVYLKRHMYGNAVAKDLWVALSEVSGRDMVTVMAAWTTKTGFPVIIVDEDGATLKITQHRFLASGDVRPDEDETLWWVPLAVKSIQSGSASVDHDAVLTGRSTTYTPASDVFKLNAETRGFYHVKYTPERLAKLGQHAASFSVADRVGLLSDATALARAGYISASDALGFACALARSETQYLHYNGVHALLLAVADTWWEDDEVSAAIDCVRVAVFRPVVDRLGYEPRADDSPDVTALRTLAVSAALTAGDGDVVRELLARFRAYMAGDSSVPSELRLSVFTAAVAYGGKHEYDAVAEVYAHSTLPPLRNQARTALGRVRDAARLARSLELVMSPDCKAGNLIALAENRYARRRTTQCLIDNWDSVAERAGAMLFGMIVTDVLGTLTSRDDLRRLDEFLKSKDTRNFSAAVGQVRDCIAASAAWLDRDTENVRRWLKANGYMGSSSCVIA